MTASCPRNGRGMPLRKVWVLYRPETGGISKVFLTEPDPATLRSPAGLVLGRFLVALRALERIGSCRVRDGRVVRRGTATLGTPPRET